MAKKATVKGLKGTSLTITRPTELLSLGVRVEQSLCETAVSEHFNMSLMQSQDAKV